jgi:hypothetical protein
MLWEATSPGSCRARDDHHGSPPLRSVRGADPPLDSADGTSPTQLLFVNKQSKGSPKKGSGRGVSLSFVRNRKLECVNQVKLQSVQPGLDLTGGDSRSQRGIQQVAV